MNAFLRHHAPAIAFTYSCFDRLLLHGYIRALQFGGSIVSFLRQRRQAKLVTPDYLRRISTGYHRWVEEQARADGLAIVTPPPDVRRHDWVAPYYRQHGGRPGVAVILKCRERARVAACYPSRDYRIEPSWRYVHLYYFYLHDAQLGRCFLRLCPYFPFDAQVCLNGHEWLAAQLRREAIAFRQQDNAFLACANPGRLLVAQAEYCHNTIFHQEAALDRLFGRLLDSNRAIGHPQKLAVIFGRPQFRPDTRTGQTEVRVTQLKTTVLKTGFQSTSLKQYVKDRTLLRTETSCFQLRDLSVPKDVQNLPKLRAVLSRSNERYLQAQQDVLASPIDRGQLERLRQPTVSAAGRPALAGGAAGLDQLRVPDRQRLLPDRRRAGGRAAGPGRPGI